MRFYCMDLSTTKSLLTVFPITALGLFLTLSSCSNEASHSGDNSPAIIKHQDSKAHQIITNAVAAHGGDLYKNIDLSFAFRKHKYKAKRQEGAFNYERIGIDSLGQEIRDVLTNEGLKRLVDGKEITITEKQRSAYTESVNSVVYFVLLPYFLLDPAVNSRFLGNVSINGEPYDKIMVTFEQAGGGVDFEDVYLYWFHHEKSTLDYLAYNYKTDGGGARFRAAFNPRVVNGIRFSDFVNYKPDPETRYINNFDTLFQDDGLVQLSLIETENIVVH